MIGIRKKQWILSSLAGDYRAVVVLGGVVACMLAVGGGPEEKPQAEGVDARAQRVDARRQRAADSARVHHLSVDAAPLYLAWWPGRHDDGGSDGFNIEPEGSRASVGLTLAYGHRLTRRLELTAGLEYLRAPPFAKKAAHHLRATTTPFVVFGSGRYYDISLGTRLGFSTIGVEGGWAPQFTTLAVLRNRFWVHENVGLLLSGSAGVHWALGRGTGGLGSLTTLELLAVRVGVELRFGPRGWSLGR